MVFVVTGVVALALAIRSLGYFNAFLEDGTAVVAFDDAAYHARLVHDAVLNFPFVLTFDLMLNHPDGARVPWPPFYDWLLALVGWCFGGSVGAVDRILSWASPVFGALTVIPIYVAARTVARQSLAVAAAALYAVLPVAVIYSRIGNPDHHAWMGLLAAVYLALSLVHFAQRDHHTRISAFGLTVVRVLVVFSWSGSLLYLAIGEAALLAASVASEDRDALHRQRIGCALAAATVAPYLALNPMPLGGWFSASALSWLHFLFFAAVVMVTTGLTRSEGRERETRRASRLGWVAGASVASVAAMLAIPSVREGLAPAVEYLSTTSGFSGNPEQVALYGWLRQGAELGFPSSAQYYGAFAMLLPLCMLVPIWALRDSDRRSQSIILLVWTLPLGMLAIAQVRWGNDFAPSAVTSLALGLGMMVEHGARRGPTLSRVATFVAAVLVCVVVYTGSMNHRTKFQLALMTYQAEPGTRPDLAPVILTRFAREIAKAIPTEPVCPTDEPCIAGGVIASPRYGHLLHYVAARPTPADPFGPQFDEGRYADVLTFLQSRDEAQAVELSKKLQSRYVMTDFSPRRAKDRVVVRLHEHDGSAQADFPALEHFRLVVEARPGAIGLQGVRDTGAPYKLFEVVKGASLEVAAEPRSPVVVETEVRTPMGRTFAWRATSIANREGRATLSLPYATGTGVGDMKVRSYRVRTRSGERLVEVTEAEVQTGARVVATSAAQPRRP